MAGSMVGGRRGPPGHHFCNSDLTARDFFRWAVPVPANLRRLVESKLAKRPLSAAYPEHRLELKCDSLPARPSRETSEILKPAAQGRPSQLEFTILNSAASTYVANPRTRTAHWTSFMEQQRAILSKKQKGRSSACCLSVFLVHFPRSHLRRLG